MTTIVAAFVLGLAGSGHCALMCGPLVSLMAPARASWPARARHAALYHGSRIAMYAAIGAVAGALGQIATVAGLGRAVAIGAGALLVAGAIGLVRPGWWPIAATRAADAATKALQYVQRWTIAHRLRGPVTTGAINGLLPCGLVYGAVAAAAGIGAPVDGAMFMTGFGLGTAPVLAAIGLSRGAMGIARSQRARRLAPVALALVGALLIARGFTGSVAHSHVDRHAAAVEPRR